MELNSTWFVCLMRDKIRMNLKYCSQERAQLDVESGTLDILSTQEGSCLILQCVLS